MFELKTLIFEGFVWFFGKGALPLFCKFVIVHLDPSIVYPRFIQEPLYFQSVFRKINC